MPAARSTSRSPCSWPSSSSDRRADPSMRRAASSRPRSASRTAWHRSEVASTAGARLVMRRTRTTSRHRPLARVTGFGPQRAATGAPARIAVARRRSPARRAAASARSSDASHSAMRPSRAREAARTAWALASPAASSSSASCAAAASARSAVVRQRAGVAEVGQLAGEARRPRLEPRDPCGQVDELGHRTGGLGGVTHAEQGLAPVEEQLGPVGARRRRGIRARGRAAPPRPGGRPPRAHGGRRRRGESAAAWPSPGLLVAGLGVEQVGLLELVPDDVVVLDEVADLRLEPVERPARGGRPGSPSAAGGRRRRG